MNIEWVLPCWDAADFKVWKELSWHLRLQVKGKANVRYLEALIENWWAPRCFFSLSRQDWRSVSGLSKWLTGAEAWRGHKCTAEIYLPAAWTWKQTKKKLHTAPSKFRQLPLAAIWSHQSAKSSAAAFDKNGWLLN